MGLLVKLVLCAFSHCFQISRFDRVSLAFKVLTSILVLVVGLVMSAHQDSMGKQYEKKITWTIQNFSSLQLNKIYSDQFVAGRCKWRLLAYTKGEKVDNSLALFLEVADSKTLPYGWKRHTRFRLTVVNQLSKELSQVQKAQLWFDQKSPNWGYSNMLPLPKLFENNNGFLVNGEVKIVAEVDVLEIIAKSDVLDEVSSVIETMDVNGFQVTYSHVETVNILFENHPDIASRFFPKNPHMRTSYMNLLLSLTVILCQPSEELSSGDLSEAYSALQFAIKAGFKLDWLEKKLKEAGQTRIQEIEQMHADMDALLEFLR